MVKIISDYPAKLLLVAHILVMTDFVEFVVTFQVPGDTSKLHSKNTVKHPAFKELSSINGEINRLNIKTLQSEYLFQMPN